MTTNTLLQKMLFSNVFEKELRLAGLNEQSSAHLISRLSTSFTEYSNAENGTSTQDQWVNDIRSIIYNEISESHFSVEYLAERMSLSSRQLRRKVKKIIGITTSQLIQDIRLEKSSALLTHKQYDFESLSKEIGISKKSYFVELFSKKYGYKPHFKVT